MIIDFRILKIKIGNLWQFKIHIKMNIFCVTNKQYNKTLITIYVTIFKKIFYTIILFFYYRSQKFHCIAINNNNNNTRIKS